MTSVEQQAYSKGRLAFMDGRTHNPYRDRIKRRAWQAGVDAVRAELRAKPEFKTPSAVLPDSAVVSRLKDWANRELA